MDFVNLLVNHYRIDRYCIVIAYEYIILDILYLFMHSVKKNVGRSAVSLHIAVIFAKIAELPLRIAHKADVLCAVEGSVGA